MYATVPSPVPPCPLVRVTHAALFSTVQEQPLPALTASVPDPPPLSKDADEGVTVYVQDCADKSSSFVHALRHKAAHPIANAITASAYRGLVRSVSKGRKAMAAG